MIIILKPNSEQQNVAELIKTLETEYNLEVQRMDGVNYSILGLIGDTSALDTDPIQEKEVVKKVMRIQEPYKKVNRAFHPDDTIVNVGGFEIGGNRLALMAGPCSVESEEQIISIAKKVKAAGANFLRGGAYKPRTNPYRFQGLGIEGLKHLETARKETGLPIVTEITSVDLIDLFVDKVDIIQVGARNMQNYVLLRELGKCQTPVLLKRGLSATIEEWLMSAEYIVSGGNPNVVLCERGIRTYETFTRNTLDLSAVPVIKKVSHLPVIVDPSHATGLWWAVEPLAMAAVCVGADGVMVEVHEQPSEALSDGKQSLLPDKFSKLAEKLRGAAALMGKTI
ncbi:MAG: 3-deoxy-7-phosphoheptulonate synthase [Eubacteriales bacterium]|nr:3-deoxy-7-phosphoheptulonate synthase [Eubacteriales bacterium]